MVLWLLACAGVCDRAVDARVGSGESLDRAAAVARCEADLLDPAEKPWIEAMAACEQAGCVAEVGVRRSLEKARAGGDWTDLARRCASVDTEPCVSGMGEGITLLTTRVTAVRDAGGDPIEPCVDLMAMVENASEEARTTAVTRCAEAEAARYATEGAAQAAANVAAEKLEIPLACSMAIERLDALRGDWAKARAQEATRDCYGELGKRVLAATVAGDTWGCSFDARRVYEAVLAHDVHSPELDAWMAQAAPLCRG